MRKLFVVAVVAVAFLAGAAPALAADGIVIRQIDTTKYPQVSVAVQVNGPAPKPGAFSLREGDRLVRDVKVVPLGETSAKIGIVLVIDTSGSMRQQDKIGAAKAAARQFIDQKLANAEIAIVAFSDQPRVVSNFTTDKGLLLQGIDNLNAAGETALWDGVRLGTGLYSDRPDLQGNLLVLSDGKDTTSDTPAVAARTTATSAKVAVFAIGLRGGTDFDEAGLRSLVSATGGQYTETTDPKQLAAQYAGVQQAIQNQYELQYQSSAKEVAEVTVTAGGLRATGSAPLGSVSAGSSSKPQVVKDAPLSGFFSGTLGKWFIVLVVLVGAGLLAYALGLTFWGGERSELSKALRPYSDAGTEDDEDEESTSISESALVRRAVDATASLARDRGLLEVVERKLEQADLPLRAPEALFFYLVVAVVAVVAGGALGGPLGLFVAAGVFALLPAAVLNLLAARRKKAFLSQLPDMLQMSSGSLRAGYSLLQAVDAVAQEVDDPMGKELRRVLAEARLGRPLEDALEDAASRMGSADFDWAVMAVRIQREVGGNLAELLDTVGDTMVARERLRREVSALTAEGRISAYILIALPIGLGVMMYTINPGYMQVLFETTAGKIMLAGGAVLGLLGYFWMTRIIKIEI